MKVYKQIFSFLSSSTAVDRKNRVFKIYSIVQKKEFICDFIFFANTKKTLFIFVVFFIFL